MALRNLFRGGHDDGQYGRDPWDRNVGGDWEHLDEARNFGGFDAGDRVYRDRHPSDWPRTTDERGLGLSRDQNYRYEGGYGERSYREYAGHDDQLASRGREFGEGFERRGWRPGSDYYGSDPERYGAGNYDAGAFGAGRYGDREYIGDRSNAGELGQFRGRGPKGYRRSDERIREEVCECLTADDRIDASDIDVAVRDSEVTLSGSVSSREEKRRAEDLIERISGVKDVNNSLRVERQ
jgi:hypothetical protein